MFQRKVVRIWEAQQMMTFTLSPNFQGQPCFFKWEPLFFITYSWSRVKIQISFVWNIFPETALFPRWRAPEHNPLPSKCTLLSLDGAGKVTTSFLVILVYHWVWQGSVKLIEYSLKVAFYSVLWTKHFFPLIYVIVTMADYSPGEIVDMIMILGECTGVYVNAVSEISNSNITWVLSVYRALCITNLDISLSDSKHQNW